MKKMVVGRGVLSPLYILFLLFGVPLLIYYHHTSQPISEILREGHYTIMIYHSAIVIKKSGKWP